MLQHLGRCKHACAPLTAQHAKHAQHAHRTACLLNAPSTPSALAWFSFRSWWWLPEPLETTSTPASASPMCGACGVNSSSHVSAASTASRKHRAAKLTRRGGNHRAAKLDEKVKCEWGGRNTVRSGAGCMRGQHCYGS